VRVKGGLRSGEGKRERERERGEAKVKERSSKREDERRGSEDVGGGEEDSREGTE